MGWFAQDLPGHEGFLVGVVAKGHGLYRELTSPEDTEARLGVDGLQVGCDCGWRSRRYQAPLGTRWFPFVVELPKSSAALEDDAKAIWREHLETERSRAQIIAAAPDLPGWLRDAP